MVGPMRERTTLKGLHISAVPFLILSTPLCRLVDMYDVFALNVWFSYQR